MIIDDDGPLFMINDGLAAIVVQFVGMQSDQSRWAPEVYISGSRIAKYQ